MSDTTARPGHLRSLRGEIEYLSASEPNPEVRSLLESADDWAVSPQTAHLLAGLVAYLSTTSVLEFGAGRSSLVLAAALQAIGGGRLTSIEHQPAYAQAAWRQLTRFPAVDCHLQPSRLALGFTKHGLLHHYTEVEGVLRARGAYDLVFIDAPPGHLGRDSTLFACAPFLAAGAVIVLDDADRPQERAAVERWTRALDIDRVFESPTVGRGVSVLRLRQPATPRFSWRTFFGTLHDRYLERRYGEASGAAQASP